MTQRAAGRAGCQDDDYSALIDSRLPASYRTSMGDESLAAISRALSETDPGLVMTSMLFEAIGRLRQALNHPDLKAVARISMASHILDRLGPGLYEPGFTDPVHSPLDAADAASLIALRLRHHPGPATAVLEGFAGEPLRVKNKTGGTREPRDTDRLRLPLRRGDQILDRACDLITLSGVTCARVRLVVVRQLLPEDVAEGLAGDLPFGTLCGERLARRARAAEVTADGGVASTALLVLDGQLAGYAAEEISRGFCEHVSRYDGRDAS